MRFKWDVENCEFEIFYLKDDGDSKFDIVHFLRFSLKP